VARALSTLLFSTALAAVLAAPASAEHLPSAFGVADRGQLTVSSSVLVFHRGADMRGGWTDESIACMAWRSLDVRIEIDYVRPGGTTFGRFRERRIQAVQNCAEGGPNTGFSISARRAGMACPDGSWRPGRYDFTTWARHRATGVRAIASLAFAERSGC
jgi:hypothetical protein